MSEDKMKPMLDIGSTPVDKTLRPKRSQSEEKFVEDWISDLAGAICDPIIVFPSPWMDTLPERIKKEVPLQRLIMLMRYHTGDIKEMTATDAEALLYMYPASLEFPLNYTWTNIYLYLGTKVCGGMGTEFPDDIKKTELMPEEEKDLAQLKRWIYESRVKHRKERERQSRREEKEEKKKAAPEVIQHAFKLD